MDALSSILKSVHLEGAVFVDAEFTAPWCIQAKYGLAAVRLRLAPSDHVVFFHFVAEGRCKIRVHHATELLEVAAGDVILFPRDDTQLMGSDLQLAPSDATRLMAADDKKDGIARISHGGGGDATRLVCGFLACSRSLARTLFEGLPKVLHIPLGDGSTTALLRELLRVAVRESSESRPGAQSTLAKLSELLFVEALRRYVEQLPASGRGWLAGVRDPHVGRAMGLMHDDPARAWTVDELARSVALSRSVLAERFSALLGQPPMQYLKRWRLALAAHALRSGRESIMRIAERSGYESEASFNRAFKREFGQPPAAWRRGAPEALQD
jgi:AraC-like DNA-binding protein